jgi:hypothetical protein
MLDVAGRWRPVAASAGEGSRAEERLSLRLRVTLLGTAGRHAILYAEIGIGMGKWKSRSVVSSHLQNVDTVNSALLFASRVYVHCRRRRPGRSRRNPPLRRPSSMHVCIT